MAAMFEVVEKQGKQPAIIKVIGVGSGGVNAVNTMISQKVTGVEYISMNTDIQSLEQSAAETVVELNGTRGRGAGGDPARGREAAIQERHRIEEVLRGADMVIVATGLGGGTGTGASPVVAEIAKAAGILTVAVVTLPFSWEGDEKMRIALEGLAAIKKAVDAYVIIPNDKMMKVAPEGLSMRRSIQLIDQVLCDSVGGVVDLITRPGYINRDFEDVRAVLQNCGLCVMGTGVGEGADRAAQAVERALNNPLLEETPVEGARHILVNIVQSDDGMPAENALVMSRVKECLAAGGRISFGLAFDDKLGDKMKVSIIASGMDDIEAVDPRADLQVQQSGLRAVPVDVRGAPAAARPGLSDQEALDRMQRRPFPGGAPNSLLFNTAEGDSELDPTPAYLRVGTGIAEARGTQPAPGWTLSAPGFPGSGRDGGQKL